MLGPKCNGWCICEGGENRETKGEEGSVTVQPDWSDGLTRQGIPTVARSHWKPGKRHGTYSPPEPPGGAHPTDNLISDIWPPEPRTNILLLF